MYATSTLRNMLFTVPFAWAADSVSTHTVGVHLTIVAGWYFHEGNRLLEALLMGTFCLLSLLALSGCIAAVYMALVGQDERCVYLGNQMSNSALVRPVDRPRAKPVAIATEARLNSSFRSLFGLVRMKRDPLSGALCTLDDVRPQGVAKMFAIGLVLGLFGLLALCALLAPYGGESTEDVAAALTASFGVPWWTLIAALFVAYPLFFGAVAWVSSRQARDQGRHGFRSVDALLSHAGELQGTPAVELKEGVVLTGKVADIDWHDLGVGVGDSGILYSYAAIIVFENVYDAPVYVSVRQGDHTASHAIRALRVSQDVSVVVRDGFTIDLVAPSTSTDPARSV